jgi:hypothetical protein
VHAVVFPQLAWRSLQQRNIGLAEHAVDLEGFPGIAVSVIERSCPGILIVSLEGNAVVLRT